MTSNDEYVLQLLRERGYLTDEQIDTASRSMKAENETTLDVLVSGGAIGEDGTLYLWGTLYSLLSVFGEDGLPYVSSAEDAVEMMLAGATAVQVGAANLVDPRACLTIID